MKFWCGGVNRVREERDATCFTHTLKKGLGSRRHWGELSIGSKYQEVVLLGATETIMDLLAHQDKHAAPALFKVTLYASHADIVIGHHDCIEALADGCTGKIPMASGSIGIARVHVKIHNYLMHADRWGIG